MLHQPEVLECGLTQIRYDSEKICGRKGFFSDNSNLLLKKIGK